MVDAARLLHDQMKFAQSQAEDWKRDHEDAGKCYVLEMMLRIWSTFVSEINKLDNRSRLLALRGEGTASDEAVVTHLYQTWMQGAEIIAPLSSELEAKGYQIEGSQDFRSAYREVKGILTADDEFFDSERLAEMRDKAIDAHRRGDTEGWEIPVS